VPEAPEAEMAPMFEEVAAHDAAMVKIAAAFDISPMIEILIPIGAIVETPTVVPVAKAVAITIAQAVAIPVKVRTALFV
jgi:hypothetical protein